MPLDFTLVGIHTRLGDPENILYEQWAKNKMYTGDMLSQNYAANRPVYTENVIQEIISYHRQSEKANFDLALDVACGSGQSTLPLTTHFSKVIGVDVSQDQIANAPRDVEKVTFRVSEAENLPFLPSGTVDLVTIATALHWIDRDRFFDEVERLLKPGGSFVVYSYTTERLDHPEAEKYMQHVKHDLCGEYSMPQVTVNNSSYRDISLPFPGWVRKENLTMEHRWTVQQYVGYRGTTSTFRLYMAANPDHDLIAERTNMLKKILGNTMETDDEPSLTVTWPITMLMAHKPLETSGH